MEFSPIFSLSFLPLATVKTQTSNNKKQTTTLKVSGLAMLCSGIWVQIKLHRYMELSTDYTNTFQVRKWPCTIALFHRRFPFQIVLVGMGLIILFVGTLACCCTVKAQSSLLYLVRKWDKIEVVKLMKNFHSTLAFWRLSWPSNWQSVPACTPIRITSVRACRRDWIRASEITVRILWWSQQILMPCKRM